ncbi:MAG: AAA family ATPase [Tannerella sp.]|jgi:AAA15 family ATPase/GTPase|nr:AAA family ATPase [Tannerella sp.]
MLNSLYVKNYRNLKELKIDSAGQINLIAGKNNTGKTSLLEAIAIYNFHLCGRINIKGA